DAVHGAVERVAGRARGGLAGGALARRDLAAWSTHRRLLVPNAPHEVVRPEVGRCPDDDAIVVVGEALRFHERLPAAVRASAEVGTPGTVAVDGADDRLGPLGRFVDRAIPEIDDPFRVSQGPAGVAARVAIIRPGGSVAAAEPGGQGAVQDRAREAAIANALELSVPARAWHPDFETDPRGARRRCEARHPAEGRQIVDDLPTRCAEGAGGDGLGHRDRRVRHRKSAEALAGRRGRRRRARDDRREQTHDENENAEVTTHWIPSLCKDRKSTRLNS